MARLPGECSLQFLDDRRRHRPQGQERRPLHPLLQEEMVDLPQGG